PGAAAAVRWRGRQRHRRVPRRVGLPDVQPPQGRAGQAVQAGPEVPLPAVHRARDQADAPRLLIDVPVIELVEMTFRQAQGPWVESAVLPLVVDQALASGLLDEAADVLDAAAVLVDLPVALGGERLAELGPQLLPGVLARG